MERKRKNHVLELGKNLMILVLTLSALYLTLRNQTVVGLAETGSGWLAAVVQVLGLGGQAEAPTGAARDQTVEVRPLRMAVNIAGVGTYGVQYDSTATDRLSDAMFTLLGETLGSMGEPAAVPEREWRRALTEQSSVYFDFQGRVPIALLYAWTQAGTGENLAGESTRRVLLAEDGAGALTFYYSNEDTGMYYACRTGEGLNGHLLATVADYSASGNDSTFAFTHGQREEYSKLAPYVMLPKSKAASAWTVYRVTNPVGQGRNEQTRIDMIESLGFYPNANNSYVAGGKQVVKEGGDTLVVYDTGAVEYHSAAPEEPKYPVGDGMDTPSLLDMVKATQHLAEKSVGALSGDAGTAGIYLMGITDLGEDRWQVDYGYHLGGITVRLGQEGYAGRFIISGGRVSDYALVLRNYTATEQNSAVLPELQAAAAMGALDAEGRELLLVYEDSGTAETVRAGWIAAE